MRARQRDMVSDLQRTQYDPASAQVRKEFAGSVRRRWSHKGSHAASSGMESGGPANIGHQEFPYHNRPPRAGAGLHYDLSVAVALKIILFLTNTTESLIIDPSGFCLGPSSYVTV